jgi:thiosulfate dehydrogenase (quinone) large subunit
MLSTQATFSDPPVARALFSSPRWAWIWLILRVYLGSQWLSEGLDKMRTPSWFGTQAGSFLTSWATKALQKATGAHPDVQGFYAWFLQHVVLPHAVIWSYAIVFGEICVGLGLILGMFTGIAAFFGSIMNFNYLLAGTVSTNPIFFAIATLLVLAWKTAGYYGVDRWLLPALGTPWKSQPSVSVAHTSELRAH